MLEVSRTFIWRTKKVIKETGKLTGGLDKERSDQRRHQADQGRRGKILRNPSAP
ncbi:Hypothetical protein FKW44_025255 [Caligus rogercresseyi]|uniref:Uncharacterized protein n=1 Tax=Caligus rogercresseyi TaxID=217165 RepID=A0A7T8JT16_CALRO|nr:Hypothetical protein FKW44_025255 [Caligus rogercresseyi]